MPLFSLYSLFADVLYFTPLIDFAAIISMLSLIIYFSPPFFFRLFDFRFSFFLLFAADFRHIIFAAFRHFLCCFDYIWYCRLFFAFAYADADTLSLSLFWLISPRCCLYATAATLFHAIIFFRWYFDAYAMPLAIRHSFSCFFMLDFFSFRFAAFSLLMPCCHALLRRWFFYWCFRCRNRRSWLRFAWLLSSLHYAAAITTHIFLCLFSLSPFSFFAADFHAMPLDAFIRFSLFFAMPLFRFRRFFRAFFFALCHADMLLCCCLMKI